MRFETINANKIEECIGNENVIIIDVRNSEEYYKGHIPTSINIPYSKFNKVKDLLSKKKTLIIYCERGSASLILSRELAREGYIVNNIYGGINAYRGVLE